MIQKLGFGGGCHWCTEAVFGVLIGVVDVQQGWISSTGADAALSEAVIVHYNTEEVDMSVLIEIHLYTHSCTSFHSMRKKYRSAVYIYSDAQMRATSELIVALQGDFDHKIITRVLPFASFKENAEIYQSYYKKNSVNQFCERYIKPKLRLLMQRFKSTIDPKKIEDLNVFDSHIDEPTISRTS